MTLDEALAYADRSRVDPIKTNDHYTMHDAAKALAAEVRRLRALQIGPEFKGVMYEPDGSVREV